MPLPNEVTPTPGPSSVNDFHSDDSNHREEVQNQVENRVGEQSIFRSTTVGDTLDAPPLPLPSTTPATDISSSTDSNDGDNPNHNPNVKDGLGFSEKQSQSFEVMKDQAQDERPSVGMLSQLKSKEQADSVTRSKETLAQDQFKIPKKQSEDLHFSAVPHIGIGVNHDQDQDKLEPNGVASFNPDSFPFTMDDHNENEDEAVLPSINFTPNRNSHGSNHINNNIGIECGTPPNDNSDSNMGMLNQPLDFMNIFHQNRSSEEGFAGYFPSPSLGPRPYQYHHQGQQHARTNLPFLPNNRLMPFELHTVGSFGNFDYMPTPLYPPPPPLQVINHHPSIHLDQEAVEQSYDYMDNADNQREIESTDSNSQRCAGKSLIKLANLSSTAMNKKKKRSSTSISRSLPIRKRIPNSNVSMTMTSMSRSGIEQTPSMPTLSDVGTDVSNPTLVRPSPPFFNERQVQKKGKGNKREIQHYISPSFSVRSTKKSSRPRPRPYNTTNAKAVIDANRSCKCSKSKCLKLYCECFQGGRVCKDICSCVGCLNTVENSGPLGLRTAAIETILSRRPDAFDVRVKKTDQGCSCKKNKCLKKYCNCFNAGILCGDKCQCIDCKNGPESHDDDDEESIASSVEVEIENDHGEEPFESDFSNKDHFELNDKYIEQDARTAVQAITKPPVQV